MAEGTTGILPRLEAFREIEDLVAFEGRGPGTDAERRAAAHLQARLESLGREAETEPVFVHPAYALTHLIHALVAITGSVISVDAPLPGALLVLAAAVSTFGDLTGGFSLARRLTPRRASQNVFSAEGGAKAGTLVLVAHYDAGRGGAFFKRRAQERRAVVGKALHRMIGPFEPFFWALMALLVCTALRTIGLEGLGITVPQFVLTVVLILSVPLFADIALSGFSPGASDNASGVATALALAEEHGGKLKHFDLWVLLPGGEEGIHGGMREWLGRHKGALDPERTVFIGIDNVGAGTVRWARREGWALSSAYHPLLRELCEDIAEDEPDYAARALDDHTATSVHFARTSGFPAVAITARNALDYSPSWHQETDTVDRIDPETLERVHDFTAELIERIDQRIGPDLATEVQR